jgi:branched-chain amino acid transport system substrate-binding protein
MTSDSPQAGRVAIVVGAAGELGRAAAVKLADRGLTVVAVDRDERALERVPDSMAREVADATDPDPFAYAQLQVLEQAIRATGGMDDAELSEYTRSATFSTVVGDVTFGRLGEWAVPRVLTVQFRDIASTDISEFAKPGARVVVAPESYASGELAVPFRASAKVR